MVSQQALLLADRCRQNLSYLHLHPANCRRQHSSYRLKTRRRHPSRRVDGTSYCRTILQHKLNVGNISFKETKTWANDESLMTLARLKTRTQGRPTLWCRHRGYARAIATFQRSHSVRTIWLHNRRLQYWLDYGHSPIGTTSQSRLPQWMVTTQRFGWAISAFMDISLWKARE